MKLHAVPGGDVLVKDVMSMKILHRLTDLYCHVDQLLSVQRLHADTHTDTHTQPTQILDMQTHTHRHT